MAEPKAVLVQICYEPFIDAPIIKEGHLLKDLEHTQKFYLIIEEIAAFALNLDKNQLESKVVHVKS